jgi:hypothetical protein
MHLLTRALDVLRPGISAAGAREVERCLPEELRGLVSPRLVNRLSVVADSIPVDKGGGSSVSKAVAFAALILRDRLTTYAEIGVYRGRSLLPVAEVFRSLGRGSAIGIDPWSVVEARQKDIERFPAAARDVNTFVDSVDWDSLYREVKDRITRLGLQDHCHLIRATSTAAAQNFDDGSLDLLHIDGNHDQAVVLKDVTMYLPKVRAGGHVILDDCSWPSIVAARSAIAERGKLLYEDLANDFAVYSV